MRETILSLDNAAAKEFLLQQEAYVSLDLPPYFTFEKVLSDLSDQILDRRTLNDAKDYEGVNYILYGNKDGKYAWRKYELANPLIYTSLVNTITDAENWELIRTRFDTLDHQPSIKCISLPVVADFNKKQKASQVSEWVNEVEKESMRLALDYEYLFQTDITDCYGSIYTHSIAWALHDKEVAKIKENRAYDALLGNKIDHHLQAMSYGQTNGIPQGSILFDFIAEMVLAYADHLLSAKLGALCIANQYHILRYRDDYRIFVREPSDGEIIMKALSEVLIDLGLRLNTTKTIRSEEVILSSIKRDKLDLIGKPFPAKLTTDSLNKELLVIYELGTRYPNCGTIKTRLIKLYALTEQKLFNGQEKELLSILINIAFDSPSAFHIVAAFLSKVISHMKTDDKQHVLEQLFRKVSLLPNAGLLEIWLQRIAVPHRLNTKFKDILCQTVDEPDTLLFETSWIAQAPVKRIIDEACYVDNDVLAKLDQVIPKDEVDLFAPTEYER